MTVSFAARRQAPAEYRHRGRSGPVTGFAQALHADLFGLPTSDEPLPTTLDALLQATHAATAPEQQTAILRQVTDQLRNAAEIIQHYRYQAKWNRLPGDVTEQLRDAHNQAEQLAQTLDLVAPAFTSPPAAPEPPGPQPRHAAAPPAAPPTPPAGRRR
ncbi:hypothetical protein ACWC9R_12180 [Streptomyces sp. NPDC001219]